MFSRILLMLAFLFGLSILTTHAQQQAKLMLPVGHTGAVNSAVFRPDGKLIVTASFDNTAKIWDTQTGKLLTSFEGHSSHLTSAVFSPDGQHIVTTEANPEDNTAKIWDPKTGKLLASLVGHSDYVESAVFSPDGLRIVTASRDNTAKIWDPKNGKLLASLEEHSRSVSSAVFSPDGQQIVTASSDNTAKIWDAQTGKLLASLEGHLELVSSALFSRDGLWIVTASNDNTAKIWDAKTGKQLASLEGHSARVTSAVFSPGGQQIATASWDKIARIWDAQTGKQLASLEGHSSWLTSALFSPDGQRIVTASSDNTAKIWDAKTGKQLASLEGHARRVNSAVFSPDGKQIVTAANDNTAKFWDGQTGKLLASLEGHSRGVFSAAFSLDGLRIVTASSKNIAKIWDAQTGKLLASLEGHSHGVESAVFSPDGLWIVTASNDNTAKIWDAKTGKQLASLNGHSNSVLSAVFSPDGVRIVTASVDRTAKIWDAQTGKLLASLEGHSERLHSAVFSPDGLRIVTASGDNTAKIWDAKTGKQLACLKGQSASVTSAVFSPDGLRILTASMINTAKIWDSKNGTLLISLNGHSGGVSTAVFSPDGLRIVTASRDNTAKIWDAQTGKLLASLEGHSGELYSAAFSPDGLRVVTASRDHAAKIWDSKTGKLKYTLLAIDSTDYLVHDAHYRYDGTENARKLLYFTCGTEIIELDQVKDQLWVPNLAERIMKGEEINSPKLSDLDLCDLIPKVEQLEDGNKGAYRFKIFPRRGGLGQTVVFVNGIEVKRLEVNQLVPSGNDYLLVLPISEVEPLFKPGQPNQVSVRAFTKKNDIGSRGATVETVSEKKSDPPALHAVVVGVSDYKGDALDLKYAAKDARDFSNALNTAAGKLFNFDGNNRIHLYPIHTEAHRKFFPDKKSIQSVFETIGKQAQPNDVLLIFFAGHGVMNPADQQFYFLTADASAMANPEGAGISTKELFEWIQPSRIKAQKRVLILDACNSGQAINDIVKLGDANQGYTGARSDEQGKFIKAIDKLNERSGLFILSAAASDQSAYEMGRYNQGVLTYALLKSAKEDLSVLEGSQFLNLGQWFDVAQRLVEDIAASSGARQQPQVVRTTNFNIGVVDEEVRKKIVLAKEKPVFSNCIFQDEAVPVDKLNLNKLLDKELSDLASRNADNSIVFYPGSTSTEAYQLTGRYAVSGTTVTLNVFLLHRGEVMKTTQLKGDTKELTKLASEVLGWATEMVK